MAEQTILSFHGKVGYETIGEIIHEFKEKVHLFGIQTNTYKKLLLVMIETLENIMKYSDGPSAMNENAKEVLPVFLIVKKNEKYIITSSNPLKNINIAALEDKLKYLNTLDHEGLKEFYKITITNGLFSREGGAGLGLIEIAKISASRIEYTIKPIDNTYSVYKFTVRIEDTNNNTENN